MSAFHPFPPRRLSTQSCRYGAAVRVRPIAEIQVIARRAKRCWLFRMDRRDETAHRWEPLPGIPENVIAKLALSYEPEAGCIVTASYGEGSPNLRIRFPQPEAFKAYEEFSDAAYGDAKPLERMGQTGWGQPWPLLEIKNSHWVARVVARNGNIADRCYRHCVMRSFDMILHVMFADDPEAELLG